MAPFDKQVLAYDDLTPKPVLAQLALDQDPAVRSQVAKNPNTPPPALATLAKDKDRHIVSKSFHPARYFALLSK